MTKDPDYIDGEIFVLITMYVPESLWSSYKITTKGVHESSYEDTDIFYNDGYSILYNGKVVARHTKSTAKKTWEI